MVNEVSDQLIKYWKREAISQWKQTHSKNRDAPSYPLRLYVKWHVQAQKERYSRMKETKLEEAVKL